VYVLHGIVSGNRRFLFIAKSRACAHLVKFDGLAEQQQYDCFDWRWYSGSAVSIHGEGPMNALRKRTDPVGRLDVAALRIVDEVLRMSFPALRDELFDGGKREADLRLGAAKLLGPRVPKLRTVRRAVKTVVPIVGAALKDARRLKR